MSLDGKGDPNTSQEYKEAVETLFSVAFKMKFTAKKELGKDYSKDGYKRMIIDDIIRPYFPSRIFNHLGDYIVIGFINFADKIVCTIKIQKSDIKVFLNLDYLSVSGNELFRLS